MAKQSIRGLLTRFIVINFVGFIALVMLFLISFNWLNRQGIIYTANYPSVKLAEFTSDNALAIDDIPNFYRYAFVEDDQIKGTIPSDDDVFVREAIKNGQSLKPTLFRTTYYSLVEIQDRQLVLSYQYVSDFTHPLLRAYLPTAETMIILLFICFWMALLALSIRRFVRRVKIELQKINKANLAIGDLDLDYPIESSSIVEIDDVLKTLSEMKRVLTDTLQSLWRTKRNQEELLYAVSHDLRTPITLIKGNLEFVSEHNLNQAQRETITDASRGVMRLEQYVTQLSKFLKTGEHHFGKVPIDKQCIETVILQCQGMLKQTDIQLTIQDRDTSRIEVDAFDLSRMTQNILQNAIEHANCHKITLSFKDDVTGYQIIYMDDGKGFLEMDVDQVTQKHYSRHPESGRGLGLFMVKALAEKNGATLQIKSNHPKGARVVLAWSNN